MAATEPAIAVVKPDHLGDFILTLPALRALHRRFGSFALFLSPANRFLYEHYLPDNIVCHPISLEYLSRGKGGLDARSFAKEMARYGLIILLRTDLGSPTLRRVLEGRLVETVEVEGIHESALQRESLRRLTGDYSRSALVWGDDPPRWPDEIRTVGISLGAGFTSNKIPLVCWLELAKRLRDDFGIGVRFTGGPLERGELSLAARRAGLGNDAIFMGSTDLRAYEEELATCDVIIGADSGNLHLASMTRPVVGVFTSSSWRRFAPMGDHVRVLFADISCSPCIQYSSLAYNACVWRECAAVVTTDDLLAAIQRPAGEGIVHLSSTVALAFAPYVLTSNPSDAVNTAIPDVVSPEAAQEATTSRVSLGSRSTGGGRPPRAGTPSAPDPDRPGHWVDDLASSS